MEESDMGGKRKSQALKESECGKQAQANNLSFTSTFKL